MKASSPPAFWWETLRAYGLLLLITIAVFWPWLFTGRALYWGDFGLYFQPQLDFERTQLRQGVCPLWNPLLFCGTPFAGNPQMWPLYPVITLLPALPTSQFLTVDCVMHVFLAGAFCYAFLRRGKLNLDSAPALLGAATYMLGGYFITKTQYPNMLQALAWTPLVLLLTERVVQHPGARAACGLGLALGFQLLASHAQVTLYTLYFAGLLGAFRLWGLEGRRWLRPLCWSIAAFCLALGLSCGQWLPVLEARHLAARQALTLAHVDRLHLPLGEWTNFALPLRFGSPLHGDWSGAGPMWETACYAGTLTIALALLAIFSGLRDPARRRETAFWLLIFLGSAWLATGAQGGAFRIAYTILPGMRYFHDPARLLLGAAVALPVLAALGLQNLLSSWAAHRSSLRATVGLGCVLLTVLDLGHYDRGLYPLKPVRELETLATGSAVARTLRADPVLASGQGRILTLSDDVADRQFLSWTDYEQNVPRYLPRLADTLLPNLPALMGLRNAGGYEPLAQAASARLLGSALQALHAESPSSQAAAPLLDRMAVRALVAYGTQPPAAPVPGFAPWLVWDDADGLHHGYVYRCRTFVPRARLLTRQANLPLGLSLEGDMPDALSVTTPVLAQPAALVLADTAFPGWRAQVDGRNVPITCPDGAFRAVALPPTAKPQHVAFFYRPVSFLLGLYVTLLTMLLLAASGVFFGRKEQ